MKEINFCQKCGNGISPGSLFCNKCGANLGIEKVKEDSQFMDGDTEEDEISEDKHPKGTLLQVVGIFLAMILVFAGFLYTYKGANEGITDSTLDTNSTASLLSRLNAGGNIMWEKDTIRNVVAEGFETDYLTSDTSTEEGCNISVFDTLVNAKKASVFDLNSFMHTRWYGLDASSNKGLVLFSHGPNDACVSEAKTVLGWN